MIQVQRRVLLQLRCANSIQYLSNRAAGCQSSGRLIKHREHDRTYKIVKPKLTSPPSWQWYRIWEKTQQILFNNPANTLTMNVSPPESVRGMKKLDRDAFKTKTLIPSVEVPHSSISKLSKHFKRKLLHQPGIKNIAEIENNPQSKRAKLFLFDPEKISCVEDFSEDDRLIFQSQNIDLETSWRMYETDLGYEHFNHSDTLKAILPEDSDGLAGFSAIGHIIHLNLKDDLTEYKEIVGQVLLDKIQHARTVVNKMNTIDNTYRNFQMELLAGEDDMVAVSKENGFSFKFDFSKVYWNPRLGTEHCRVVDELQRSIDVVYDVFAGVGPFSVPAAKRKCHVLANDLNPESYKWLNHNITLNKVPEDHIKTYNLDGRTFIQDILKQDLSSRWQVEATTLPKLHVIMNLPALAVTFLDAFVGMFADSSPDEFKQINLPKVHCYSFSKSEDPTADVLNQVEMVLQSPLPADTYKIRTVRKVAPNKDMMYIGFELPKCVLFAQENLDFTDPPAKRVCLEPANS